MNVNKLPSCNQHILPDVLKPSLKVVFCGMAAGDKSAKRKAYYAGPGNKFWHVIHEVGLTSIKLEPPQFERVLRYGLGLTDLVKDQSGGDNTIRNDESYRDILHDKILKFKPRILCFNGKNSAKQFLARKVSYGFQMEKISETKLFVAPSTSGAANGFWNIDWWYKLADSV